MKTRLITGILLVAIFVPLIAVEQLFIPFQILIVGLVAGATYEMIKLFETKEKFSMAAKIVIYISTILIYFSLLREWILLESYTGIDLSENGQRLFTLGIGFTPMIILVTLIVLSLLVFNDKFDGGTVGRVFTTILYVGLSFAAITILRYLGIRFVVYLFLITILTDVFAYAFGMKFGKHKMAPKISPKKSWEGAIGGTAVATIVVTTFATLYGVLFYDVVLNEFANRSLFYPIIPLNNINNNFLIVVIIFFITLGLSIAGQLGDLIASKFKRTYDIKDFGKIFPGHGGILDRLDSAMVASLLLVNVIIFVVQIVG